MFKSLLQIAQDITLNPPESCTSITGETESKIQLANSAKKKEMKTMSGITAEVG